MTCRYVTQTCARLSGVTVSLAIKIASVCLITAACLLVRAEAEDSDVGARLVKIKGEVSATESALKRLKEEFLKLKKEEKDLEAEIQKLSFEEQGLVERSVRVAREKEALVVQVREAEQRVEEQRLKIRDRLRILYMNSQASTHAMFLRASNAPDLERLAVYARAVRSNDDIRFAVVKQAVEELNNARVRLDASLEEGKRLQTGIQTKRVELEARRTKLQSVLRQIQDKQQSAKTTLALLMSEAAKLESLMQSITGGDEQVGGVLPVPEVVAPAKTAPSPPTVAQGSERVAVSPERRPQDVMHPEGLFGKSVRVVFPVKGDVLQRFGKTKVADFSDIIFSKGLEYKTPEGSQVRAVLGGKVAFAGAMPGYDTVVIIDHGSRSYSLYGRLGKSLVQTGAFIAQRDVIGVTSTPDSKGRNFYFETRRNGSPVDPSAVLGRAS